MHKVKCHSLEPSPHTLPEMQSETDTESVRNAKDSETDVDIMEMV